MTPFFQQLRLVYSIHLSLARKKIQIGLKLGLKIGSNAKKWILNKGENPVICSFLEGIATHYFTMSIFMIILSIITNWYNNALLYKICIITCLYRCEYVRNANEDV